MQPLVEPGEELTADEFTRYSRQVLLPGLGSVGQRRLKNARVLVIGAGGLGSPVLTYLAAAGVGTISVIDDDVVEVSNLHRQVLHAGSALGTPKVDSAVRALAELNPLVKVESRQNRITRDNALEIIEGHDVVLDGTDNFATRYLVGDACSIAGVPLVWGSVFRFDGQVSVFWSRPPQGHAPVTYRDLHPTPPPPGSVPSCAEGGVLGVTCAAIGSVMATEAIKLITGVGEPLLGRIMLFDAAGMTWQTIRVRPAPDAVPISELAADYEAFCGIPAPDGSGDQASDASDVSVGELARRLERRGRGDDDFVLVDVREPEERLIASIPGAVGLPMSVLRTGDAGALLAQIAQGRPVVLHCKSGGRSAQVLEMARDAGLDDVAHVPGGVLRWIDEIDPTQPRY
ncbi:molybdopterin-synthase adenylyltransferase MoeB [Kineosporia sp. NBRC 101731]|uniref:molybdopterin-synthase adenylyltransferase MoeB n=1 Tax=Kineosporia sp. NBRC 101731 TaxID=3032199 RepID=UPI0024A08289|nr:molybdopterin-synthase adenylyltransferase MoeB [Kineosporia sp. NBRC 101731]GLY28491.1 adenylyltransferase/sulfurtransferase MoeZ [Kineosporia sp. NBRC 101731]